MHHVVTREVAQGPLGHSAVMHAGSSRIPPAHWMPLCGFHGHLRCGASGALIGFPGTHRGSSGPIAFTVACCSGGVACGNSGKSGASPAHPDPCPVPDPDPCPDPDPAPCPPGLGPWAHLGCPFGCHKSPRFRDNLWAPLCEPLWPFLGPSWDPLGHLGAPWGFLWAALGPLGLPVWLSQEPPVFVTTCGLPTRRPFGHLGTLLALLGRFAGAPGLLLPHRHTTPKITHARCGCVRTWACVAQRRHCSATLSKRI